MLDGSFKTLFSWQCPFNAVDKEKSVIKIDVELFHWWATGLLPFVE
jgi:hypothetical protein